MTAVSNSAKTDSDIGNEKSRVYIEQGDMNRRKGLRHLAAEDGNRVGMILCAVFRREVLIQKTRVRWVGNY